MTKKEMVYEIIANTKIHSLNERDVLKRITEVKKSKIEEIHNAFLKDKEHAKFYFNAFMYYN